MARTKSTTVSADRFDVPPAPPTLRLGYSDLPPGRFAKPAVEYGSHFRRVLADGQTIDYTVTPSGLLVEKVNFVPSKTRRDGNAAYGRRWLGILEYRQSDDYVADLKHAVSLGMKMDPAPKVSNGKPSGGWVAC